MASDYSNLSKQDLVKLLQNKDKELKSKKYGIVWDSEREPEQVVLDCENNLPVLKKLKTKEIKTNTSEDNILIEGDNYHALSVLNYTHKEKVDVIYIDPPYNTGNNDFVYNDKYVDKEDGYRHSKWLNFMEKRLRLAHNLLKKTGVIFISIDDNEMAQLKLLCDKIFGEGNFVGDLIWRKKEGGGQAEAHFVTEHEYVLCYSKSEKFVWIDEELEIRDDSFKLEDEKGKFALVKLSKWGNTARKEDRPKMHFPIKSPNGKKVYPVAPDGNPGRWRVGRERMNELIEGNSIEWKKVNEKWIPYEKVYFKEGSSKKIKSRSILYSLANTGEGTKLLTSVFSKKDMFENPKPLQLIKFILDHSSKKESLVLDFMAGSGTTGHAVLDLNKEDGGNRKFILCTNNENNICSDITYPRLEKVIKGYKKNGNGEKIKGLGGNLQYLKTSLVKSSKNREQLKVNLTRECTEMLCLKENIFNLKKDSEDFKIFESNDKNDFLCIYYNFLDESFDKFLKEIKKIKGKKKIYIFSLDNSVDQELFDEIDNFKIESIPQKILDIYRQLVKQNIPMKKDLLFLELNKAKKLIFEEGEIEESPKRLRIALENVLKKIARNNSINIFERNSEKRTNQINEELKNNSIISKVEWEENKTYLAIGNYASHGDYSEYNLEQIKNFYKHVQTLINKFEI